MEGSEDVGNVINEENSGLEEEEDGGREDTNNTVRWQRRGEKRTPISRIEMREKLALSGALLMLGSKT